MSESVIKDRIRGWYNDRAKNETDPFYAFLGYWICFNAWLEFESQQTRDRDMIDWLKAQTSSTSQLMASYDRMATTTSGAESLKNLASTSPIANERRPNAPIAISDANDKENIIEALYLVRCNLFHGGKDQDDSRDRKIISYANGIFSKWLADLVSTW